MSLTPLTSPTYDIQDIASQFMIDGDFVFAESYGSGHINDTFAATYDLSQGLRRYILQRINHDVFTNPIGVMENIERVLIHLRQKLSGHANIDHRALSLLPTQDGRHYYQDAAGNVWRMYPLIEGARTVDIVESTAQAYEVGKAFGDFQTALVDLPEPRLVETIPHFHDTPKRFADLEAAIEQDVANRAKAAKAEIDFALSQAEMTGTLVNLQSEGEIPERITHNDTKINNVLLDNETDKGLCVIDLDTVMPGLVLYDFGDMVRTATCFAAEDERDLSQVKMEMPIFEALAKGYVEATTSFLNPIEKQYLAFSGKLITFEIGIRFLTDHLSGDTYFKTHRPNHNLDRCRTQFKLVESIMTQETDMARFVEAL
ncbi:MAG: aminoglycoside phosphotransferase family protein [Chloroflexota bacterium]